MVRFAYVEDGKIVSVYDRLPDNWKNFSNFSALEEDEQFLKTLGWYRINKIVPEINTETQHYGEVKRWIENDNVYETEEVIDNPIISPETLFVSVTDEDLINEQWELVRRQRDEMIADFDWRYLRYHRETRLGLEPTDNITAMDTYIQSLADLPENQTNPFAIVWPVYNNGDIA